MRLRVGIPNCFFGLIPILILIFAGPQTGFGLNGRTFS